MRLVPDRIWGIMTVWQESRGEAYLGKVAVAEVILRRTARKYMSNGTVSGTVLSKYQFSGWNTGDVNRLLAAQIDSDNIQVQECIKAWDEAEQGSNLVPDCLHYFNPKVVSPYWAVNAEVVADIGNHRFVKVKEG